ncbi:MAG TPA: ABC transporter transmembrane domain-containing protein [Acidobacteriota bacterium]|nr:ABC transporter transmembrane domain-containing protein [Acidobacteriota bacterium]
MHTFWRLVRYVRPYVGVLLLAVILTACVGLFEAARTALIKPILDGLTASSPVAVGTSPPVSVGLTTPTASQSPFLIDRWLPHGSAFWSSILGLMISFTFLRGVSQFFSNYLLTTIGQKVIVHLRQDLFAHLLAQSNSFFHQHRTSDLTAHIISDVEKTQLAVSLYLADALREGFTLICLLVLAFVLSWKLTLVSLAVVPFVATLTARFGKRLRMTSHATQEGVQEVLGITQETLSHQQIVKAFGAEKFEEQRFLVVSERLRRSNLRTARALFLPSPIMDLMGVGIGAVVIYYTQHLIATGQITVGGVTATLAALFQLYDPVRKLSQTHNAYSQVAAAAARVFRLLDQHTEIQDLPDAIELTSFSNRIEFSDVTFTYPGTSTPALDRVNLVIEKGQMVALVGRTGSGKSTLLNLLLRFYDCDSGVVLIDGVDVRAAKLASLRAQMAMVSQESVLFQESFQYNIAYGAKEIDPKAVEEAAKAAYAQEFIEERGGYRVNVGESGKEISGGQRQRIAIARALYKNAPILLLDEATSHLDTESERIVQQALTNLTRERTTLVIAHRLSTIQQADKIVVLNAGQIVETGTHDQLLATNGLYRRLYDLQFVDESVVSSPSVSRQ